MVLALFSCLLFLCSSLSYVFFFFFNDTATTEIYTLSLHDALPTWTTMPAGCVNAINPLPAAPLPPDRKSTRLNSSHVRISYAVFCLKKKKKTQKINTKPTEPYLKQHPTPSTLSTTNSKSVHGSMLT